MCIRDRSEYLVRIRATDAGGLSVERDFLINVTAGDREMVARYLFENHEGGDIPNETGPGYVAGKRGPGNVGMGTGEFNLGMTLENAWWKLGQPAGVDPAVEPPMFDPGPGFVRVERGGFMMGNPKKGRGPEGPVHEVYVDSFFISELEVTKALWLEVMEWGLQNGYNFDYTGKPTGSGGRIPVPPTDDHPIVGLTWHDMLKWCNARSEMEGRPLVYFTDNGKSKPYRIGQIDNYSSSRVDWRAPDIVCPRRLNGKRPPVEAWMD